MIRQARKPLADNRGQSGDQDLLRTVYHIRLYEAAEMANQDNEKQPYPIFKHEKNKEIRFVHEELCEHRHTNCNHN